MNAFFYYTPPSITLFHPQLTLIKMDYVHKAITALSIRLLSWKTTVRLRNQRGAGIKPCGSCGECMTFDLLCLQVHTGCKEATSHKCPLGQCRISILPPTAISNLDSDGFWRATKPQGASPLLVFVNSKSGDNQVKYCSLPCKLD